VLLDRQSEDDVEVLVLRGRVVDSDAGCLRAAVADALDTTSRGVVVDLTATEAVEVAAVDALAIAARQAGRWPRPSVVVCGAPSSVRPRLEPAVTVHADRRTALAHVDDREVAGLLREVVVEHGPQGPRQAREAVEQWSADIALGAVADDLLLIVSELVTNAVRHGRPPVRVTVCADDRSVTVGVVDAASTPPLPRVATDDAESGRGLLLLSLLSVEHGVRPEPPGKVVWASLERA
jgi:anti-sigma regulatory factor (Ser/Thr protein kinase)/anti-anti-sigma regulatory factor